ncbi:hypothetical protein [Andreprevotia chitinilytica]|uniref:hypothetical protein n=1 Tax=Andreprevotia chitinilytica TaxID=396808 RepID=UPI001470276F|nr:hypothetical protein [Andreprevotia chitinilytica]
MRWLAWTLAALLALVLVLVLILGILNHFDENLEPTTQAWLKPEPQTVSPQGNAYFYFYGFGSRDLDPAAAGKLWVEQNQAPQKPIAFSYDRPKCPKTGSCLDYTLAHRAEFDVSIAANTEILKRYQALIAYPRYEEVITSINNIPQYAPISTGAGLYLAQQTFGIAAHQRDAGNNLLHHLQFWTEALHGSRSLLSAMIAAAQLKQTMQVVNEFIEKQPTDMLPIKVELRAALQPLTTIDQQKFMTHLWQGEFYLTAQVLQSMGHNIGDAMGDGPLDQDRSIPDKTKSAFSWLFYQPNATLNLLRRSREANGTPISCDPVRTMLHPINPVGRILVCISQPDTSKYGERIAAMRQSAIQLTDKLDKLH